MLNLIQERLFEEGENGNLLPKLGLAYELSKDRTFAIVRLRQGVSFHDGTPFNADAVVAHWSRLLNPKNRYRSRMSVYYLKAVTKQSKYEVRFQFFYPTQDFHKALLVKNSFMSSIPSPKSVKEGTQVRHPVGTGPFQFKSWKSNFE
ncbi:MAG: hypothetical protein COB67_11605 [SAR324 cluster bacterium]|uniref:Solute-binding protein family 5 domain-containing protein n=1 Tax=SAR324 cluster bacterium TaxID=2024889 RepID=A0A2A4STJ3_9DELT|nr:MAG: hypothetical protein COB67_11605 [SAR324 cluster bacterium]